MRWGLFSLQRSLPAHLLFGEQSGNEKIHFMIIQLQLMILIIIYGNFLFAETADWVIQSDWIVMKIGRELMNSRIPSPLKKSALVRWVGSEENFQIVSEQYSETVPLIEGNADVCKVQENFLSAHWGTTTELKITKSSRRLVRLWF